MTIRGVLFDKDGTLIDVNGTWVPIYRTIVGQLFNVDEAGAEALMEKAGFDPVTRSFVPGSTLASGTTRQIVETWWPGHSEAEIAEKCRMLDHDFTPLVRSSLKPLLPLGPVFDELHALGLRLGVATNDSHLSAVTHMEHLGVRHYFDDIIAADTVPVPKPSGDMVRRFAAVTGLKTTEIAMVGDNSHDMDEARAGNAGLAVAVLSGNGGEEHISHLADHTLASIADLPALLKALG
jgi:phosphoglycolate phosphatase